MGYLRPKDRPGREGYSRVVPDADQAPRDLSIFWGGWPSERDTGLKFLMTDGQRQNKDRYDQNVRNALENRRPQPWRCLLLQILMQDVFLEEQ